MLPNAPLFGLTERYYFIVVPLLDGIVLCWTCVCLETVIYRYGFPNVYYAVLDCYVAGFAPLIARTDKRQI
jgi:hypothetical protein